jgi:hypothetical protein
VSLAQTSQGSCGPPAIGIIRSDTAQALTPPDAQTQYNDKMLVIPRRCLQDKVAVSGTRPPLQNKAAAGDTMSLPAPSVVIDHTERYHGIYCSLNDIQTIVSNAIMQTTDLKCIHTDERQSDDLEHGVIVLSAS